MTINSNFRRIEAYLYNYKRNRGRLQQKREELERLRHGASVQAQSYDGPAVTSGGKPGDPVASRVARIDELEHEIAELERCVNPITRLVQDLTEDVEDNPSSSYVPMKLMLEKRYFGKCTKDSLALSERTYRRVRHQLIKLAGDYMALPRGDRQSDRLNVKFLAEKA